MAKGNEELVHKCSPQHLDMGTARMNDIHTEEEKSDHEEKDRTAGRKKDVQTA